MYHSFAVSIGLITVNLVQPGTSLPKETQESLQATYSESIEGREQSAREVQERGKLDILVDIVPDNFLLRHLIMQICFKLYL